MTFLVQLRPFLLFVPTTRYFEMKVKSLTMDDFRRKRPQTQQLSRTVGLVHFCMPEQICAHSRPDIA